MECDPEELRSLGAAGICRASAQILRGPHRPLFARIADALVLPLSALFLLHIAIYHVLFFRLFDDDDALDASTPGSDARRRLYNRVAFDYAALLAFKAAYLVSLLFLSLLATAAAVFAVASVYSAKQLDALSFARVLSAVPRIWRRLAATFLVAFALQLAYNAASFLIGGLFVNFVSDGLPSIPTLLAVAAAYFAGLVYLSELWHLASVVSVLEDRKGLAAMRRSKDLVRGKLLAASAIFAALSLVFAGVELAFRAWVVWGGGSSSSAFSRLLVSLIALAALCCVVTLALVAQTLVYLVCKSYHRESIDKAGISDHLDVYLGDYVPLQSIPSPDGATPGLIAANHPLPLLEWTS